MFFEANRAILTKPKTKENTFLSTLMGETPSHILTSEEELYSYFEAFKKTPEGLLLGLEAEFLAVSKKTGKAIPYEGSVGIEALLKAVAKKFHYEELLDEGRVIALKRKDRTISLEPGGQVELSASPVKNCFEIKDQIDSFLTEFKQVLASSFSNVCLLAVGMHPFSELDEVTWVPKTRYKIMSEYLKNKGTQSHEMMKRTATNQLNVDYVSEEDAMDKLRVALGITSIVTAIFSNSSFSEGSPNGFMTRRLDIWNHTDPERSGLLFPFLEPNKNFKDYLRYILDMPMFFIIRKGNWIPLKGLSLRNFIKDGFQGERATMGDFELHLSTAFPEVRIKQFLEVRGVDAQAPALIPAVAAFWKGILYSSEARQKAWDLVSFATEDDRRVLHHEVARLGLKANLGSRPIYGIAKELVDLSCQSLARQKSKGETRDECYFLEAIREMIIRPKRSPGQTLLEKWEGEFLEDPRRLIDYLSV